MTTGGKRSAGFTIIETLIVLGVSAALASSAFIYIAGRQNKTQFIVAINGERQAIQQIINETLNGFYPHNVKFTCQGHTDGTVPTFSAVGSAANGQGTNAGCTFLGKVVAFGVDNASNVSVYPLIGNQQFNAAGVIRDAGSFTEAHPQVLGPGSPVDLSTSSTLENGLSLVRATYTYSSSGAPYVSNHLGLLVFADNLAQYTYGSGYLDSAAERLDLFTYPVSPVLAQGASASPTNATLVNGAGNGMNASLPEAAPTANSLSKVDLCFASGGTNQSGLITITGQAQLAITLTILGGTVC